MDLENELDKCIELYKKKDYRGLISKCDEILAEFPDEPDAMRFKGAGYFYLEDYDNALKVLKKAHDIYPDHDSIKTSLAMVYFELGEYSKTIDLC